MVECTWLRLFGVLSNNNEQQQQQQQQQQQAAPTSWVCGRMVWPRLLSPAELARSIASCVFWHFVFSCYRFSACCVSSVNIYMYSGLSSIINWQSRGEKTDFAERPTLKVDRYCDHNVFERAVGGAGVLGVEVPACRCTLLYSAAM